MVNQPSILDGRMHSSNQGPVSDSQFAPLKKKCSGKGSRILQDGPFCCVFFLTHHAGRMRERAAHVHAQEQAADAAPVGRVPMSICFFC